MKRILDKTATSVSDAAKKTSQVVTDAITHKNTQAVLDWAKEAAGSAAAEVGALAKEVARSDMVKDAAVGAAIGAVVAIPVPLIGPAAGGVVGAGVGLYKNLTKQETRSHPAPSDKARTGDLLESTDTTYEQLLKLDELRIKGILTEEEFQEQKSKLLNGSRYKEKP
ncbi:SHOCT domain-containing protein [Propionivibrio sp.]|uniref:SHOCT domain-containing protein n=1 Tax=Propionivibrio sp. TaxID=2212460 RepID=UPI0039E58022